MSKRVVVTGIGTFSPFGKSTKEAAENLFAGQSSIKLLPSDIIEATKVHYASYFTDYNPSDYFTKKEIRTYDVVSEYALLSAKEAVDQSKLAEVSNRDRIGCNITSGIGGFTTIEDEIIKASTTSFSKISPMFIPRSIINIVAGNVAIAHDAQGICNAVVSACASSTDAIGHAKMYIENGLADIMITGGSEATINKTAIAGFSNIGALNKTDKQDEASIPFDTRRNGFVMGEGACVLVLEEYEHAVKRGAHIYGEILGYGASCDASHITAPDASGLAATRAIKQALNSHEMDTVAYINAHGTSTPLNDQIESSIYQRLFDRPRVTSSKALTGHMLGAAGATEVMISLLSLQKRKATELINSTEIDPEFKLSFSTKNNNQIEEGLALSVSLGFGGHNAALLLGVGIDDIK